MADINIIAPAIERRNWRKRVAAYARVSMDTEQLEHSFSNQIAHFNGLIQSNPAWEFAGIYADRGITGTKPAPRTEFLRMLADCEAGKIDLVLAKSVSRFARDTVDCLNTIRHLKTIGVEVRFERENISTFTSDGELLLTLLASFAQAESESISANVRWVTRKRFEEGIPNGHRAPYGYRWDGEKFRIIPEQGEVVKQIYARYLAGESAYKIAKDLREMGITGQGGGPMSDSTIKDIVSSESYTGTMILQKNYITDTHKRRRNYGELARYAVTEMFEPLVSAEDFERARAIRQKRADTAANKNPQLSKFSGLVKCGNCGHGVSRRTADGKKKWVCNTRERKGVDVCDMRPIMENELERLAEQAVGDIPDEEFRRAITCIRVHGDSVEFVFANGRIKSVKRTYTGKRGSNPFTNKIYCGRCGCKCERDNGAQGTGLKIWRCPICKGHGLKEPELIKISTALFGKEYGGQIVETVKEINIAEDQITFTLRDRTVKTWQLR